MIICICEGINETRIRQEIRSGAGSVGDLARCTGAGTGCGLCTCDLKRLVVEARSSGEADAEPGPPTVNK